MVSDNSDLFALADEIRRKNELAAQQQGRLGVAVNATPAAVQQQSSGGGSRLGAIADFARAVVPQQVRDVAGSAVQTGLHDVGTGYTRLNQASLGFFTGNTPAESIQQAKEGLSGDKTFSPEDLGFARLLPKGSTARHIVGTAAGVAVDPVTLATVGAGDEISAGLHTLGPAGRLAAALMAPVSDSPSIATRLFSQVAMGTGAQLAQEAAANAGLPTPVVLAAGLAGGAGGLWTGGALKGSAMSLLKDANGTFRRDSMPAIAQELGHDMGGRTFLPNLLPFDTVKSEIHGPTNPLEETALGQKVNSLVNPSKNEGDLGVMYNAYTRQATRAQQLAEAGAAAAIGSHDQGSMLRGPADAGGRVFNMDDKGFVQNIRPRNGDRSTQLGDILSTRDAPSKYYMNDAQVAMYNDTRQFIDEAGDLAEQNGLPRPAPKNFDSGQLYWPRIVRGKGDIEFKGPTNSTLQRVFEDQRDGVANGVNYENNPQAIAALYAGSVYRAIADKQFTGAMADMLVAPKDVMRQMYPGVVDRAVKAAKDYASTLTEARNERTAVIRDRADVGKDILREAEGGLKSSQQAAETSSPEIQANLAKMEKRLSNVQDKIAKADPTETEVMDGLKRQEKWAERQRNTYQQQLDSLSGQNQSEVLGSIDEARNFTKSMPNVRSRTGPPITDAMKAKAAAAQDELNAAKLAYRRAMASTRAKEALPEFVFGNNQNTDLIRVGTWKGKFLPEDADYLKLADQVNTMTGRPNPVKLDPFSKVTQDIAGAVRFFSATGDLGMPFIQGLPLFGRNPYLWAKMAVNHYHSFLDPAFGARYIRDNLATVQEMALHGVPVGELEQFHALDKGLIKKAVNTKIGQQTIGRTEAAYNTGLTANRALLWDAMKPGWDGTPAELAAHVRQMTGALDPSALGISPTQRALESAWMGFSPRLMRSTIALAIKAGNPTSPEGRAAARSLLGLAAFGGGMLTLTNMGIGMYNGESQGQIKSRIEASLNPLGGRDFMAIDLKGQKIGIGGQVRAIAQFAAKAMAHPAGFATANEFDNPLINFYMGRGAVATNIAGGLVEGATGGRVNVLPFNYIDNIPDAVLHAGESTLPFVVQAQIQAQQASLLDRATMGAVGFAGANYTEESAARRIDRLSNDQYGKPYTELTGVDQQRFEAEHADLFALKAQQLKDTSNRDDVIQRQKLAAVDETRISGERTLTDAFNRGLLTGSQYRDEMKALQRDAVVAKREDRNGAAFQTTDANKLALSAWYNTFDQSRIPGTQVVNWDQQSQLENDLFKTLTPDQRNFIDQRRVTQHAPEAQPYFDNEKMITDSGYWDAANTAFDQVAARLQGNLPQGVQSYSQLVLALNQANESGDKQTASRLNNIKNQVDNVSTRLRTQMRQTDPALDVALVTNQRVSKPIRGGNTAPAGVSTGAVSSLLP